MAGELVRYGWQIMAAVPPDLPADPDELRKREQARAAVYAEHQAEQDQIDAELENRRLRLELERRGIEPGEVGPHPDSIHPNQSARVELLPDETYGEGCEHGYAWAHNCPTCAP